MGGHEEYVLRSRLACEAAGIVLRAEWREAEHPRVKHGHGGGEFTRKPSEGGGTVAGVGKAQFTDQGPSPLDYRDSTWRKPDRVALVDPTAGPPPKGDLYFAETRTRTFRNPDTGRRLKNPRVVVNPGAAPGTVAFADYSREPGALKIHYMKTRGDRRGQHLAEELVDQLISRYPDAKYVDFGKMMTEATGKIKQAMAARHPDRSFHGKVYW